MKRIFRQEDVLNQEKRVAIIKEIIGDENSRRKLDMLRRHEILRDKNRKWVVEALSREGYKKETLAQMQNRAANISIARRICKKLARTYVGGVERKAGLEDDQQTLDGLAELLKFNSRQKKADLFRQCFKNTTVYIKPVPSNAEVRDDGTPLYELCMEVLAPWQYDVIEDYQYPTRAMCYVLTDFPEREQHVSTQESYARGAQGYREPGIPTPVGDGREQVIADSPEDRGKEHRVFIFWTDKYHLTCDVNGKLLRGPGYGDGTNPIGMLPFVDVHDEQDGNYWAEGGDDVIEGSVLINKLLTDNNYLSFVQGWGQLCIAAPEIPKRLQGGPDNAFVFETKEGAPPPNVWFATSNPPVTANLENVTHHLAMLLSTNGLSPRTVSAKLDANNVASGIAMLIENSDVDEETRDVQPVFVEAEPREWRVATAWHRLLVERKVACKKLADLKPMTEPDNVSLKFMPVAPPVTESEKVEVLTKRKKLGIDTLKDLIKRDNPDLTDEQVEAKLKELKKERQENAKEFGLNDGNPRPGEGDEGNPPSPPGRGTDSEEDDDEDEEEEET